MSRRRKAPRTEAAKAVRMGALRRAPPGRTCGQRGHRQLRTRVPKLPGNPCPAWDPASGLVRSAGRRASRAAARRRLALPRARVLAPRTGAQAPRGDRGDRGDRGARLAPPVGRPASPPSRPASQVLRLGTARDPHPPRAGTQDRESRIRVCQERQARLRSGRRPQARRRWARPLLARAPRRRGRRAASAAPGEEARRGTRRPPRCRSRTRRSGPPKGTPRPRRDHNGAYGPSFASRWPLAQAPPGDTASRTAVGYLRPSK